jgi:hypothetical protein
MSAAHTLARTLLGNAGKASPRPATASWRTGAGAPGSTRLMVMFAALCAFAAAAFAPRLLWDGDTLWHLAAGGWMLDHHQIAQADPFSYTVRGKPWTNLEWLSEIVMTPVWRAGGWSALVLMFGLAVGALTWILGSELSRWLKPLSWSCALVLALACTAQSWLARPHLLVLPILALWTVQLMHARERGQAPPLWLLPVMALWANLHGSFLFGLALLGPFAAEALIEPDADRLKVIRGWGLFGLAAACAAMITPHGPAGLIYPVKLMSMTRLQDIVEWKSSDFSHLTTFEVALLTTLAVLLYRGVKVPLLRLVTILGLLHLTLQETRHQMVLATVAVLLLAEPLGQALGGPPDAASERLPPALRKGLLAALALACVGLVGARFLVPAKLTEGTVAPMAALAHVPQALRRQPVLNEYGMGGFLIFNHVPVFIDGRADMYGDDYFGAYVDALKPDPVKLKALLDRYKVRWTILRAENPALPTMDAMPGWKRLYADKWAVVHVKNGA